MITLNRLFRQNQKMGPNNVCHVLALPCVAVGKAKPAEGAQGWSLPCSLPAASQREKGNSCRSNKDLIIQKVYILFSPTLKIFKIFSYILDPQDLTTVLPRLWGTFFFFFLNTKMYGMTSVNLLLLYTEQF